MYTERIQKYNQKGIIFEKRKNALIHPVEAITFDTVEISEETENEVSQIEMLVELINKMSDREVAGRIKKYRDSFETIDDALVDKLFIECL